MGNRAPNVLRWRPTNRGAAALLIAGAVSAAALCTQRARADDSTGNDSALPVEVHGFVSQGFIKTTANNYLAESKRGSFEFSEVALNFSKDLTDRMRVGMQLFSHDLGPLGNYRTRFDWFYLDYRFWDWLGVRAGRTKLPFGLYNESSDIDAARVPILLPQSVYPVANRDFLLAQTGAELYGNVPLGAAGVLEYRVYGGTVFFDTADAATRLTNVSVPYLIGGRLMWQTPLDGLQLGGSAQKLRLDAQVPADQVAQLQMSGALPPGITGVLPLRIPALLGVGSAEYNAKDLLVAAEYSRWRSSVESPVPAFATEASTSERFYLMSSYHVRPWFSPGLYYSVLFGDVGDRSGHRPSSLRPGAPPLGRGAYQHDLAVSLRFDVNPNWIVKVEGHRMHGTAGLSSSLNDNAPTSSLTKDWGLFLIKTTAYF
ncbi:MAG: hypothetical protein ABJB12_19300 [Pseudomonadota bacterium]